MPAPANLTGQRFGRLFVREQASANRPGRWWLVVCDCGATEVVPSHHLLRKRRPKRSCGCLQREAAAREMALHNKRETTERPALCQVCGRRYTTTGPNHKYCSPACKRRAYRE